MSIKSIMYTALMTVAPTAPAKNSQHYSGKANTYITFFRYNRMAELYAENDEIATTHFFQVDLWQKENGTDDLDETTLQIETALISIGFMGFSAQDLYEDDTKTNHIAIRCNYTEDRL